MSLVLDYIKNMRKRIGHDSLLISTVGVIIIKNNKILLQKRADNNMWAIHGGSINLGESFIEGLERELKEELNISPINPILYGIFSGENMHYVYPNQDEAYFANHIFFCKDFEGEIKFNDYEVSEIKCFDTDKLPDHIHPPDTYILQYLPQFLINKTPIIA